MSARCSVTTRSTATFSRASIAFPLANCAAKIAPMRSSSIASSGWFTVATKSWRRSATTQPSALVRPGPRRDQHLRDVELARQRAGVQRAGAAEGEEREVARVVAARQAHHADRARHPVVADAHDRCGRCRCIEAERRADVLEQRGADRIHRHRMLDREQALRIEPAKRQVGIGDGGACAAAAIADRPGHGTRALGADAQHARRVDRRDRAAAGAYGVHVDHRHVNGHRVFELEVARDRRPAAEHERNVARRAAHVVGDDVAELAGEGARLHRRRRRRDHARGRARHHRRHRVLGDDARRHGAAVALHHQQLTREAAAGELALQALDVAVQHRLDRGVDGGRGATLVLAVPRRRCGGRR